MDARAVKAIEERLPQLAHSKLRDFTLARDLALDASRSANARLNALPRDADQQMRERLASEQGRQNRRHGQLHALLSKVQQWLSELPATVALQPVPPVSVELKPGEKLSDVITGVRNEIAAQRQKLDSTRRAPLPLPDQKQLAEEYVVGLMRQGRPSVRAGHDKLHLGYKGDIASPEDVMALLAWAAPEQVCRALERELEQQPARADALSSAERLKRISELEAQLLELESREEALITAAAAEGVELLRRADASVPCVLGVTVARAQAQVA